MGGRTAAFARIESRPSAGQQRMQFLVLPDQTGVVQLTNEKGFRSALERIGDHDPRTARLLSAPANQQERSWQARHRRALPVLAGVTEFLDMNKLTTRDKHRRDVVGDGPMKFKLLLMIRTSATCHCRANRKIQALAKRQVARMWRSEVWLVFDRALDVEAFAKRKHVFIVLLAWLVASVKFHELIR
jgi:hypothetical protein